MDKNAQKELLTILVTTVVAGFAAFFLAGMFDKNVSEVTATRYDIDDLTRSAVDPQVRAEENEAVEEYTNTMGESLPSVDNIVDILRQLEVLSQLTNTELVIKLEEGVVGEGQIDFTDDKEREKFLKTLEVKEYQPPAQTDTQTSTNTNATTNVALQMTEQKSEESKLKINYIEITLDLTGTYQQIRTYLSTLENSKYIFSLKELRLNKIDEGNLNGLIRIRAFIFET